MIQEIITYIILTITACFIAYKLFFRKSVQHKGGCGDCESSCSGCELTQLKKEIRTAQKSKA